MYAAWQDVLSLSFWKISALFSKSRLNEYLHLLRFKKPYKTPKYGDIITELFMINKYE